MTVKWETDRHYLLYHIILSRISQYTTNILSVNIKDLREKTIITQSYPIKRSDQK